MKKAKNILYVITIICILVIACFSLTACNDEEDEYVIGIISDPQIVAESDIGDDAYPSFLEFNAIGQKMLFVSEAILKTAVDEMIERKVDCVLMPGDLTENGSKVGHETVARECARLEEAGIDVYVTCGNHDINKEPDRYSLEGEIPTSGVTPEEFMTIFADYGFNEAIANDILDTPVETTVTVGDETYTFDEVGTMSYVCNLGDSKYRLISIDATNYYYDENDRHYYINEKGQCPGSGDPVMTARLLEWTKTQLKQAGDDGKTPLVMIHFPVTSQMGDFIGQLDTDDMHINMQEQVLALLTEYDVEYVFTGHLHTRHDNVYTDDNGTLYDIETGCLTNYPNHMRIITMSSDGAKIEDEYLQTVKAEYVPSYVDEETKQKITTDLPEYAIWFVNDNLRNNIQEKIDDGGKNALFLKILDLIGFDEEDQTTIDFAEDLYQNVYLKFINTKIYGETDSIEAICKKHNVTLPKEEYDDVFDFIVRVVCKVYKNEANVTSETNDGVILKYVIYSAFDFLNDYDLFAKLHELNSDIEEIDLSELVNTLFDEGILDLNADNFLGKAITLVKPLLKKYDININLQSGDTLVLMKALKTLAPAILSATGMYDSSTKTILGIAYTEYIDFTTAEIFFERLLDEVVYGQIGKGLLN